MTNFRLRKESLIGESSFLKLFYAVYHSFDLLHTFFSYQFNIDLETKTRKFVIHDTIMKQRKHMLLLEFFRNVEALSQTKDAF